MSVLILGDTHFPYVSPAALARAVALVDRLKPTTVVQIGDLYEMAAFARWDPSHEGDLPSVELETGRAMAADMWETVRGHVPKAKCFQLLGNHDVWPLKRMWERMPAAESLMRAGMKHLFSFPGVTTARSDRDVVRLGRVGGHEWHAAHGWTSPGRHATHLARNVVVGHLHRGYTMTVKGGYTELNAGWLGDWESRTKWYTPARVNEWQCGVGIIDELGPRFVSFEEAR